MNDFRYALRTLGASRGFTFVAIATLALGIGANTAIFSVVNGVLLKALSFAEPERIVRVFTQTANDAHENFSAGDFRDVLRENQSLSALAGYRALTFSVTPRNSDPVHLDGAFVTAGYFDVLGVAAARGRTFTRAADTSSRERRVVLAQQAARDLYGSADAAVGERLRVDGEPYTIIGVLPAGVAWPERSRLWVLSVDDVPPSPVALRDAADDRGVRYFDVIARVKPGVSLAESGQDLHRIGTLLQQRRTSGSERRDISISSLREEMVGDVRFGLLVMQAAVGLVLLIACANVSSVMIARALGRQRDLAIRAAIGAGRWQLMRQLLIESLVLAVAGGWAGLLMASWLIPVLLRMLPAALPRTQEIGLDAVVAGVTFATALASALAFGTMPAIHASRADSASMLKQSRDPGTARARTRAALVVVETSLTVVLLAGAGLLLNSFLHLQRADSGLDVDHVTLVDLMLPQPRYPSAESRTELYRHILEGLTDRPEIQAAGVGFPGPLRGSSASSSFEIEGRPADAARRPFANLASVSGQYFAAMGIPLIAGRTFEESDRANAPGVAIVNATLSRRFWPGENALGKRLRLDDSPDTAWTTVVGVVGDVRQLGLAEPAPPMLYIPYQQFALPVTEIAIRSAASQSLVVSMVRQQVRDIDPDLPVDSIRTLDGVVDRSLAQPRFRALLVSAFAGAALVLAAVGLFGLISYSVNQRRREVGIRMALGADPRRILHAMMREGLGLTLFGLALGLGGALAAGRIIRSFLFGVQPADPLTLGSVALLLLAVATLATYIPSRQAMRVDPVTTLRAE